MLPKRLTKFIEEEVLKQVEDDPTSKLLSSRNAMACHELRSALVEVGCTSKACSWLMSMLLLATRSATKLKCEPTSKKHSSCCPWLPNEALEMRDGDYSLGRVTSHHILERMWNYIEAFFLKFVLRSII